MEGWGEVVLITRNGNAFVFRTDCLQSPLSLTLSPRSAGGAREPEALVWWMRLKWPIPSRLEMVSNQPLHFPSAPLSPA